MPTVDSGFEEVRMEALTIPAWSQASGRTLGELSPAQNHDVQIAGVRRGGLRILNPGAQELLRKHSPTLAGGFAVGNVEAAPAELAALRQSLGG